MLQIFNKIFLNKYYPLLTSFTKTSIRLDYEYEIFSSIIYNLIIAYKIPLHHKPAI